MGGIITYDYVKGILDKPTLSFIDFQTILSYLYKKLSILINLKLRKELVTRDLNLLNELIVMLEIKVHSNQIDSLELKDTMLALITEYEKELEKVLGHG